MNEFVSKIRRLKKLITQGPWNCFSGGGYVSVGKNRPCEIVDKRLGSTHPFYGNSEGPLSQDSANFLFIALAPEMADLIEKQDSLLGLYRRHKELLEKYRLQPSINAKKRYAAKIVDEFQKILEQIKQMGETL